MATVRVVGVSGDLDDCYCSDFADVELSIRDYNGENRPIRVRLEVEDKTSSTNAKISVWRGPEDNVPPMFTSLIPINGL